MMTITSKNGLAIHETNLAKIDSSVTKCPFNQYEQSGQ